MAEITLEGVTKRFEDGTAAVRGISFTVRDGEFFILVGPSGCGKSTLLQLIVGLETPTDGVIRVDGRVVNDVDPRERDMAMVFQSYALYPHMSVHGNLAFPLELAKVPQEEIRKRVQETAAMLGIAELLDRKPFQLSGGQRQRVAMGRAMVRKPRAYLMDEPLSNLDARLRLQMRAELSRLHHTLGVTTIYVTHDQTEAMTLGDRIAVLVDGAIVQIGTPRQLYARPANLFVAGFIGSPRMNLLEARATEGRLALLGRDFEPLEELRARLAGAPAEIVVGVRPEDLLVAPESAQPLTGVMEFETRVDVAEWLGADLYVHLEPSGGRMVRSPSREPEGAGTVAEAPALSRLVARLDPAVRLRPGDRVRMGVDPRRLHFFDARSGEALALGRD